MVRDVVWTVVSSPVDELLLMADDDGLTGCFFSPHKGVHVTREGERDDAHPVLAAAREQLAEYFAGDRTTFDLPLAARGTPFKQRVWAALREIPYGETESYGGIAARLGLAPGASRAVGLANGSNPISIIVPCHRVIGADGSLTGFGGGIERKRYLLHHERDDALF
jgi:methylated-DNA-[protein]-cysteine S-methyltransferase